MRVLFSPSCVYLYLYVYIRRKKRWCCDRFGKGCPEESLHQSVAGDDDFGLRIYVLSAQSACSVERGLQFGMKQDRLEARRCKQSGSGITNSGCPDVLDFLKGGDAYRRPY